MVGSRLCHICGEPLDGPGLEICSAPHDRTVPPLKVDFDSPPDPIPEFPFPKDADTAKDVAWLVFSRLYTSRLNNLMCVAPIGFRDEIEQHFGYLCTKYRRRYVMFECDYICDKFLPEHYAKIMAHRSMVYGMLVRAATMYPGTANSISADEAMILATALGLDGVGKLIPLQLENGNLWSSV